MTRLRHREPVLNRNNSRNAKVFATILAMLAPVSSLNDGYRFHLKHSAKENGSQGRKPKSTETQSDGANQIVKSNFPSLIRSIGSLERAGFFRHFRILPRAVMTCSIVTGFPFSVSVLLSRVYHWAWTPETESRPLGNPFELSNHEALLDSSGRPNLGYRKSIGRRSR